MKTLHFYSRFSAFILFFFMSFLPFFFLGIDAEYNLNQQIDRGYISRNAVFFAPDLGQDTLAQIVNCETEEEAQAIIEASEAQDELESQTIVVPDNQYRENGLTNIETILSSGGSDYFAAVHKGKGRFVYFSGNVMLPPILEGRFFTSKECLSREPMAVIGKDLLNQSFIEDGKRFIYLDDLACEVVGIAGIAHDSTIDALYFINLGAVSPDQQIGRYYVDGDSDVNVVFEKMQQVSSDLLQISMRKLDLPMTYTDAVTGNVYMKTYLKAVVASLLVFIYLSILSQALSAERRKIGILKVVGISTKNVNRRVHWPLLAWGASGIALTLLTGAILVGIDYFALPLSEVIRILITCSLSSSALLVVWLVLFDIFDRRTDLREVTQQC
ncbi:MAG: ABC transporter permease [Clostridiaceae bacterium]|nr:ABC transporter permease [Clostridiaceae bacterium]